MDGTMEIVIILQNMVLEDIVIFAQLRDLMEIDRGQQNYNFLTLILKNIILMQTQN